MIIKNILYLLKMVTFRCLFTFLFIGISLPYSYLQAQDPDEEGEISWEDEEEYELEEDEFADEEEFLDDEEYYEDEEDYDEDYDDEYYEDNEIVDEEDVDGEKIDAAGQMERSGWSVDISGAAARLVNYTLWKEYGLNESSWEPSMQGKVSIEAPYMLKLLGLRFRIGAEVGTSH